MAWQDFLNTPGAKEYYIRSEQFLDIDAPKSSKVYRNAYRYLDLIATGKRSGQESPDYKAVVDDAKRLDAITRRPPQPPQPPASGRMPTRLYVPGRTLLTISNDTSVRVNFGMDISSDPDDMSNQFAESGDYINAIVAAFSEQTGQQITTFVRGDGAPLLDSDARPVY